MIKVKGGVILTNIIDGMDIARFQSGVPNDHKRRDKQGKDEKKMPTVLKNLKNGS